MVFYFSSDFPSAIKLGGIFYGRLDKTVKKIKMDLPTFVEICPLNEHSNTLNLLIDQDFLSSPPNCVSVTDLKGSYLIKAHRIPCNLPFKLISQSKENNALVTLFTENTFKISIETGDNFFADSFDFSVENAKVEFVNAYNQPLVAITLFLDLPLLVVYSLQPNIQKVFSREISSVCFENGIKTTHEFLDMAKHTLTIEWDLIDGAFKEKSRLVTAKKNIKLSELPLDLLPFAFLEELLVGGDYKKFLCDNALENADKLPTFLGNFIGVFPPPEFRKENEVGLVYSCEKNTYTTEYFSFEMKDDLIFNVKKTD